MTEAVLDEPVLLVDLEDGIATLTVNRPNALNALNSEVLREIHAAAEALVGKASGILVTGAGGKAFVAGADIAEMKDYSSKQAAAFSRRGQAAFQALQDFPGPVVAAIPGFALGGGLELALACDILVAAESAKLGLPEATLAVVPGFGGTQRLPRRVGPGKAKQLLFTGAMVDATEAKQIGLVDEVVADDQLMETARNLLAKASRNGPLAVQACKRLVNDGLDMDLDDAIDMEAREFGSIFGTQDQTEGMAAFLEKRKPTFAGN